MDHQNGCFCSRISCSEVCESRNSFFTLSCSTPSYCWSLIGDIKTRFGRVSYRSAQVAHKAAMEDRTTGSSAGLEPDRRTYLASLTKEELIDLIVEMESKLYPSQGITPSCDQLSEPSESRDATDEATMRGSHSVGVVPRKPDVKVRKSRQIDFSLYGMRHVALKFLYLGWNYDGFVVQDGTQNTVEDHVFAALAKTKLIESRETSSYHRCGRTDKTVSAFSQVISLNLRTTCSVGRGVLRPPHPSKASPTEIPYLQMLNGVLPKSIRVITWCGVDASFSARFSCTGRKYRYYFPKGNLDTGLIRTAARFLLGEHDFRNFCKADINGGVTNYVRRMDSVEILEHNGQQQADLPYQICVLEIRGSAFLWHQIRCIAALLFLVGQKKEQPEIIKELLDIAIHAQKPQYAIAEGFSLVLFECDFESVVWEKDQIAVDYSIRELQKIWTEHAVKARIVRDMIDSLEGGQKGGASGFLSALLQDDSGNKTYRPLKSRQMCDTIESRLAKKAKIDSSASRSRRLV